MSLKIKKFQKKVEDFFCEHCGKLVKGSGFTDHCPKCLWSRHVDINPGDRKAKCLGLMAPKELEIKSHFYFIHYQCLKCGYRHRIKSAPADDFTELIKLSHK